MRVTDWSTFAGSKLPVQNDWASVRATAASVAPGMPLVNCLHAVENGGALTRRFEHAYNRRESRLRAVPVSSAPPPIRRAVGACPFHGASPGSRPSSALGTFRGSNAMRSLKSTDIRIREFRTAETNYQYRTPLKFGGRTSTQLSVLTVSCEVETRNGRRAVGRGMMTLGNTWSYPSRVMTDVETLEAMRKLADRGAVACASTDEFGHAIDLGLDLERWFLAAAVDVRRDLGLAEPIPKLASLVTASPFDAAVHDAYGRALGLNCYDTYNGEFMSRTLGDYLGKEFAGLGLEAYVRRVPIPRLHLFHLVGALDPLEDADLSSRVGDGLPETLQQWIRYNNVTHFKIKLNGDNPAWDLERILAVDRVVTATAPATAAYAYSLDFNEGCRSSEHLAEFLHKVRERDADVFDRIQYLEQPAPRNLLADPAHRMHAVARLKPVVIDESLTDMESLLLARAMGYSGAALKTCKGQSQSLLMAAAVRRLGMYVCVQDLTCPGAALIQSAGLAARVPGVTGLEANSRQFCPAANAGWESRFPDIFRPRDGCVRTDNLTGMGLGAD